MMEFVSEFVFGIDDGCWAAMLKSSSRMTDVFQRVRAVGLGALDIGVEYKLKFVGLITPDMFDRELE